MGSENVIIIKKKPSSDGSIKKNTNRPFFGTINGISWAVCIEGLDSNSFPEKPYGRYLSDLRKFKEFVKGAKKFSVSVKGKPSLSTVRDAIRSSGCKQFAAQWQADNSFYKDDVVDVFIA